ncbi:MAG: FHA domain-containing protein [Nannocystaceae bacterium]
MHTAILEITHPCGKKDLREMLEGTLSIGSENGGVVLRDPKVCGVHGRLKLQGMALTYVDLGSTAGSFIDTKRITAPLNIAVDETIKVGTCAIKLAGFGLRRSTKTEVTVRVHRSVFGLPPADDDYGSSPASGPVTHPASGPIAHAVDRLAGTLHTPKLEMLTRVALDGNLVRVGPRASNPSTSPLNMLPYREARASVEPVPLSRPSVEPTLLPDLREPAPTPTTTPWPTTPSAAGASPIAPAPLLRRQWAHPSLRRIGWTLLSTAAVAGAIFFAWQGGYLHSLQATSPRGASRGTAPFASPGGAERTTALANTAEPTRLGHRERQTTIRGSEPDDASQTTPKQSNRRTRDRN